MSRLDATVWIDWEIAFFHRRWLGWRSIIWWAWPVRWVCVVQEAGVTTVDYYETAAQAAKRMSEACLERCPRCRKEFIS